MGANKLFYVKSIATYDPTFFWVARFSLAVVKTSFFLVFKVNNTHEELTVIINIYCSIRASSKSSRSESAHPVSDTGAIKRQDNVDGSTTARKQSQFSNNSALGKLKKEVKIVFKNRKRKSSQVKRIANI